MTLAKLREITIFQRADPHLLEALIDGFATEEVSADRLVFQEGDPADRVYVIARGVVDVLQAVGGHEQRVAVLEDGDVFGEIALVDEVPRTATIRTRTPCTFLTLSRERFSRVLQDSPEIRQAVHDLAQTRRVRPLA